MVNNSNAWWKFFVNRYQKTYLEISKFRTFLFYWKLATNIKVSDITISILKHISYCVLLKQKYGYNCIRTYYILLENLQFYYFPFNTYSFIVYVYVDVCFCLWAQKCHHIPILQLKSLNNFQAFISLFMKNYSVKCLCTFFCFIFFIF